MFWSISSNWGNFRNFFFLLSNYWFSWHSFKNIWTPNVNWDFKLYPTYLHLCRLILTFMFFPFIFCRKIALTFSFHILSLIVIWILIIFRLYIIDYLTIKELSTPLPITSGKKKNEIFKKRGETYHAFGFCFLAFFWTVLWQNYFLFLLL